MSSGEICGGSEFRREEVEVVSHVNGHYALVEHIPATVWVQRGDQIFAAATAEGIRRPRHERPRHQPGCGRSSPTDS